MTQRMTVAEFARQIQRLAHSPSSEMELRFYFEVLKAMSEMDVSNLVPITITCSVEDAQKWALPLDMHILQGGSGTLYLSWSKGLDKA